MHRTLSACLGHATRTLAATCAATVAFLAVPAHAGYVNIQPIQVCDDAGGNCANPGQELFLAATNKIWAQAGLTFNYLPFTTTNSSQYLALDNAGEVAGLFNAAPGAASNPLTISMWFVGFHFDAYGEVNDIGGNKIVIEDGVFAQSRLDTIAHELGHLLGLLHDDPGVDTDYLMRSGDDRLTPTDIADITPDGAGLDKLTAEQIALAQSDAKVINDVPEPASQALVLAGLGLAAVVTRRRKGARG